MGRSQPAAIVADPSSRFVCVANAGDDTISSLDVDDNGGASLGLAVDPRGLLI